MSRSAGSIVCPACGAGVVKSAVACPYCGAEVVLPKPVGAVGPAERKTYCTRCGQLYPAAAARCPRCPPATEWDRGGRCPRCAGDLAAHSLNAVTVDRCAACRGMWFDGDEIEHAIDVTTKGVSREEALAMRRALPHADVPVEEVRYLACVRCGERMARRQAAPRAGTIVDVCREHGVWFDGGEFDRFAAFVKAGGLDVVRHDGIAAAEIRKRPDAADCADLGDVMFRRQPDPFVLTGTVARDVLRALRSLFRRR